MRAAQDHAARQPRSARLPAWGASLNWLWSILKKLFRRSKMNPQSVVSPQAAPAAKPQAGVAPVVTPGSVVSPQTALVAEPQAVAAPVVPVATLQVAAAPSPPPVSATPGLDAYRELLDLQDSRDRHLTAIDDLNAEIGALQVERAEHDRVLKGMPAKALNLQERVRARTDAIVGAFPS